MGRGNKIMEDRSKRQFGKIDRRIMAMNLPEEKVQQMFAAYCSVPTFSYVSRVCRVNSKTVKRYHEDGNWDERREAIVAASRQKVDMDISTATMNSLSLIQRAKEKLSAKVDQLLNKDINPAFLVSDIEKVVKLEQLLLGGVSDRKENISTTHEERIRKLRDKREIDVTPTPGELTA